MTQDERDLLLKDLCGRLPYKVMAQYYDPEEECETWDEIEGIESSGHVEIGQYVLPIESIKPYLFPISSMTEEQKKEFKEISECKDEIRDYGGFNSEGVYLIEIGKYEYEHDIDTTVEQFYFNYEIIDWLNKNHFDYRGLIEKGLAIDATGLNVY